MFERDLSSGLSWDEPPFKVTASNITQDKETGIGNWSDADIKKALQKGERPNGVRLAAIMPSDFYEILTPGDLNAIVAYLRTVKPVKQETPAPIYRIALPRHIPPGAEKPFTDADMADKVKKGFYLVTIGHCMECHTPMGPRGRDFENSFGKGGFEFKGPWGTSVSRNITSHKEKGIGAWSDAEIKRAITDGVQQGRLAAQAADGLRVLQEHDRGRSRRDRAPICARAAEGVDVLIFFRFLLADRVVEVHRREIVGEQLARLRRAVLLGAAREQRGKREAEAEFLLQRARARCCEQLRRRARASAVDHRDHLALAGRIEVQAGKHRAQGEQRRGIELGAVVHVERDGAARREALLEPAYRTPWSAGGTARSRRGRHRPGSGRRSPCGG